VNRRALVCVALISRAALPPSSLLLDAPRSPGPLAEVEWIARQKEPGLSRPEAIRRLVEIALKAKK
jgi:hypothetical protein